MAVPLVSSRRAASRAPAWSTTRWLNGGPLDVPDLAGRVVVLEAFQMLCPGCVGQSLPQARRLTRTFGDDITVVGLHTVFEHHDAMTETVLAAFLHQNRIRFPVGIDTHDGRNPEPVTFTRYHMQGTPTVVLIDRAGLVRAQHLGAVDDMPLAAAVTRLLDEPDEEPDGS